MLERPKLFAAKPVLPLSSSAWVIGFFGDHLSYAALWMGVIARVSRNQMYVDVEYALARCGTNVYAYVITIRFVFFSYRVAFNR